MITHLVPEREQAMKAMTAAEEMADALRKQAHARFFIRIGGKARGRWRDENTLPLFPLPFIMDCEGLLAHDARRLVTTEAA